MRDVDLLAERGFDHVQVDPGEVLALVGAGLQGIAQAGRGRVARAVAGQVIVEARCPGGPRDVERGDRGRVGDVHRLEGRAGGGRRSQTIVDHDRDGTGDGAGVGRVREGHAVQGRLILGQRGAAAER